MAEITEKLLEQLIDCQEGDVPSARIIALMASEIMRMRSYGDMIPAPDADLKQRSVLMLRAIKNEKVVDDTLSRLANLLQPKLGFDCYLTFKDLLAYVADDAPLSDDSDWAEIDTALLQDCDNVIHDAVGFGGSHSHKVHNDALITLRKYLENAQGSITTMVPKQFLRQMHTAVGEIVYGKVYPMSARESLKAKIGELINEDDQDAAGQH
ncbi:hypothetical protein [Pseudomonas putida]|uniref:Uncharacterized protein n=1 Tax=Pseudomonas putida TaxID=303 RepID=A0A8I1EB83_PSEPU|nr:hypothetical protein [Pseudomonas putida]MBI6882575.1 hypothetical protein [Pseudomonas putida]